MYINDDIITGLLITIACIVVVCGIIAGANWTSEISCNAKANALGYKCDYGFWEGCVLTTENGDKILLEQLREYKGDK